MFDSFVRGSLTELAWPKTMFAPFQASKLSDASVAWLNRKWFVEQGLDVLDPFVLQQIEAWLIDEFGYVVPAQDKASPPAPAKTFLADRYGGSGLAPHGGSGRAGISGKFQVKGIGATPLVGEVDDWAHSHGCCWLEEALREATFSLVADAEFPHGASPVIAVLDTGVNYVHGDGEVGERRALLIRPAPFRPAHLQRASLFNPSDEASLHHLEDVARVKDAWNYLQGGESSDPFDLVLLTERMIDQIIFGQVYRLFHGGYFTSNVTIDGQLLDFGSFSAVADWFTPISTDRANVRQGELSTFRDAIGSLAFYIGKYQAGSENGSLVERRLLEHASKRYKSCITREFSRLWGLDGHDSHMSGEIGALTEAYFNERRRERISLETGQRSPGCGLHRTLKKDRLESSESSREERLWKDIRASIHKSLGSQEEARMRVERARMRGRRLLSPRWNLERDTLQRRIFSTIGGAKCAQPPASRDVHRVVCESLSNGRRVWKSVPDELNVVAQVADDLSAMLLCVDGRSKRKIWIEASIIGESIVFFDQKIPLGAVARLEKSRDGALWRGVVDGDVNEKTGVAILSDAFPKCSTPPFSVYYDDPATI